MQKLLTIILFTCCINAFAQVTVTTDSTVKYQTIEGWGHGGGIFGMLNYGPDTNFLKPYNLQLLDFLIDDLGLTGSRMWEVGPRIDGTGMDDGNCDSINWSKFQVGPLDTRIAAYTVYFRNRIVARGFQPSFYSSPGYPTHATDQRPWVMNHPGERAQQIWANALWWKNNYGININYDVIYNEPPNIIPATLLADDIKALGSRLLNKGLTTKSQYAEGATPQQSWNFITPVQNDSDLWPFIGRLSYHNYGSPGPQFAYIRDFGKTKNIPTAQTEMGDPNFDDLYNDLTLGGVSYWEVAYSGSNTLVPSSGNTNYTPEGKYFRKRQLMHYVRPGAVRIGATTTDSTIRVLSFDKYGLITTVIENIGASAKTVTINGLPTGKYGLTVSNGVLFQELGIQTINSSGTITLTNIAAGSSVTTLYPYSGINQPPTIMTWTTSPGYVMSPASTVTLAATASDAELDALTFTWSVVSKPAGANPVMATPNAANTNVSGLNIAGNYVFNINVSDGLNTSSRKVYLIAYASNPPPVLWQSGFRFPSPYGLMFGANGAILNDTTHAIIELPVSYATLQVGVSDLANSDFTGRGTWSLVKQPTGANVILGSTYYIYISMRSDITGMTVPGDYVFRVNVTNPPYADITTFVKCTVNAASSGPVINSISSNPPSPVSHASSLKLTAITTDPQGQLLRHWWVLKSAPIGAKPVFATQGLSTTNVSGLSIDGNYIFTLRAFDDIHMTTQDISVMVNPFIGIENIYFGDDDIIIYPNPTTEKITIETHQKLQIEISNIEGQVIKTLSTNANKTTIDLSNMTGGVYIIKATTDKGIMIKKFINK